MDIYFPIIQEKEKKKQWEPESLYIEVIPLPPEKKEDREKEPNIIIIQL